MANYYAMGEFNVERTYKLIEKQKRREARATAAAAPGQELQGIPGLEHLVGEGGEQDPL